MIMINTTQFVLMGPGIHHLKTWVGRMGMTVF